MNISQCLTAAIAVAVMTMAQSATARVSKPAAGPPPSFHPEIFFNGHTEGSGSLKVILRQRRAVHVHGQGHIAPDGMLQLDQEIEQAGTRTQHRRWEMRSMGAGRYTATLSDAAGPVIGEVRGNVMRLAFPAKGGLRVRQVMTLAPDGQTVDNRLTIRKFGIVVAVLNETIRHIE